jgi:hypothetical protein
MAVTDQPARAQHNTLAVLMLHFVERVSCLHADHVLFLEVIWRVCLCCGKQHCILPGQAVHGCLSCDTSQPAADTVVILLLLHAEIITAGQGWSAVDQAACSCRWHTGFLSCACGLGSCALRVRL